MDQKSLGIKAAVMLLTLMMMGIIVNSCTNKEDPPDFYTNTPSAGFSWSGNEGPAPVTIQFYNSSENADKFEWTFDDGQSSMEKDPQHTFYNSGSLPKNFNVVLKATDSYSGLFDRRSRVIVIQPQK